MNEAPRYIVVEGPIGVGKTALAELLAQDYGGRLIREPYEENPFLKRFYENPRQNAFSTQLFCLLSRYQQQKELLQLDLFQQVLVSDYCFDKDRIFAYLNLSDDELSLYEKIYTLLVRDVRPPDLVVYLQASPEVLLRRLKTRGHNWERKIALEYLEKVSQAYKQHFFHYRASPLLVVNTSEIDFVANPEHYRAVFNEIRRTRSGVRQFILKA